MCLEGIAMYEGALVVLTIVAGIGAYLLFFDRQSQVD